jgi:hypothetical protein
MSGERPCCDVTLSQVYQTVATTGKLRRQTLSRTVVQFRPFVIKRRQEDNLPAHLKGAAVYLETGEQEGYFVFDILANKYLAVEYEEVQGTWFFVQQDK